MTWNFYTVTKYRRHIVGTKLPEFEGRFFHGEESEYLKSRNSLIIKDLWTWYLWQPTNAQFWEVQFKLKCRKIICNLVNTNFNKANVLSIQWIKMRKGRQKRKHLFIINQFFQNFLQCNPFESYDSIKAMLSLLIRCN